MARRHMPPQNMPCNKLYCMLAILQLSKWYLSQAAGEAIVRPHEEASKHTPMNVSLLRLAREGVLQGRV